MEEANTAGSSHPGANINKGYHLKILRSIRQIIRAIDIDPRRSAKEHKVTGAQFQCLMAVIENDVTKAVDAAKHVHFNLSTKLYITDIIESNGPVWRDRNSPDRCHLVVRSSVVSVADSSGVNARAVAWSVVGEGTQGTGSLD